MKYRREIDGLRALAVVPVILFHAGISLFAGGFVGVDIFFVISGFLITTIIAADMDAGSFSVLKFYERRARRILPALFLVMAFTLPFAWLWMSAKDLDSFGQSLMAVPLFSSNILFYATSNYFGPSSALIPLLHTWSLAVEEQYYVFFPLFMMLAWRLGRGWLGGLLGVFALLSLLAAQHFSGSHPSFTFYMLPTRGFEILIGALISSYRRQRAHDPARHPLRDQCLSLCGLSMITISIFAFNDKTPTPSFYTLVPTLGAALVILFANARNVAGKILGSQGMVGVGLISYSAYLWHQPLLAFARLRLSDHLPLPVAGALCALSLGLGLLSWRWVETPFRDRRKVGARVLVTFGLVLTLGFIGLGALAWTSKGFPQRLRNLPYDFSEESPILSIARIDNGWCFYSIDTIGALKPGRAGVSCAVGAKAGVSRRGLLFGDSFAGSYEPLWDQIGRANGFQITSATTNWCFPTFTGDTLAPKSSRAYGQCLYDQSYVKENFGKYDFVILGGRWSEVIKHGKMDQVVKLIGTLSAAGKLVVVMSSPKQYDVNPQVEFRRHFMFHRPFDLAKIPSQDDEAARQANDLLETAARQHPNVVFLARETIYGGRELSTSGAPYSADGWHVSISGAEELARRFVSTPAYAALVQRIKDQKPAGPPP